MGHHSIKYTVGIVCIFRYSREYVSLFENITYTCVFIQRRVILASARGYKGNIKRELVKMSSLHQHAKISWKANTYSAFSGCTRPASIIRRSKQSFFSSKCLWILYLLGLRRSRFARTRFLESMEKIGIILSKMCSLLCVECSFKSHLRNEILNE